jgi:RHS repeat-associated protein
MNGDGNSDDKSSLEKCHFYGKAAWQLVEERIDDDYDASFALDRVGECFWGVRYIDDLAMRRITADEGANWSRWQPVTDAQFSVRAMLKADGSVAERVDYEAYGLAEHHWGGDVDGDGDVDSADSTAMTNVINANPAPTIGASTYQVEFDLDRDGDVDSSDANLIGSNRSALPAGWISGAASGDPDSPIGFDGYVFSKEVDHYCVRFRWYDAELGRWLERDPETYVESMNLYQYANARTVVLSDPFGQQAGTHGDDDWSLTIPPNPVDNLAYQKGNADDKNKGCGIQVLKDHISPPARWGHTWIEFWEPGWGEIGDGTSEQPGATGRRDGAYTCSA